MEMNRGPDCIIESAAGAASVIYTPATSFKLHLRGVGEDSEPVTPEELILFQPEVLYTIMRGACVMKNCVLSVSR